MKRKINIKAVIFCIAAVLLLVGFDQLTKYLVSHSARLLDGDKIIVIKHIISFYLTYNTGAAWSILSGHRVLLVMLSIMASIACIVFIVLFADFSKKKWVLTCSITLISAGAIGNLIDRAFFENGVIDFLCFEFIDFPIFNVADSLLTVGAVILFIYFLFIENSDKNEKKEDKEEKGQEKLDDTIEEKETKETEATIEAQDVDKEVDDGTN